MMPDPFPLPPSAGRPPGQPVQLALATAPHRNQQLFSDHVLDDLLPSREDWQMLAGEATPVLTAITALWQRFVPSAKEAQTEDDLVKPVLKLLGHRFEIQPSLETPDGTKAPDYVFYQDQAMLDAAKGRKLTDSFLQGRAYAVGDAKHWERPLDTSVTVGSDFFSNKNPSYQISFYMQHSGLAWGILTNGRLWRLYHQETAHKLDRFYEVDLSALLATGDVYQFLYFYAFFRRQAFEPGALSVAAFLQASADYARRVGDSLKEQVYEALRHVAQGLLDYPPNHLHPDQETLERIYRNALIVLYRLLFILYAEARDLLPLREHTGYRETYSLESIKKAIEHAIKTQRVLLPTTATLWPQLKTLFTLINEGSPPLKVATFNGGLFDPARHLFLEQQSIGDAHLQQAVDKLARVEGQFVDYRDLAERHLGTIYEGLLEFHLEPLATPEDGWTVALVNAKGERKATGSYYTPDYIVKYMVEETLGPLLRRAVEGAASDQEKIERVLALKILDPAMGSGHFPVEAMEYIARFLVQVLEQPQTETGGEADLAYWKRRVAQACIYGVDLNPLAVDLAKLSLWLATVAKNRPLSFLDHHLRCGNSLIGARIADLRIGRAGDHRKAAKKVAQPNETATTQLPLFDEEALRQQMTTAVHSMSLIEGSPAQTVAEVKEQEQTYEKLRQNLIDKYGGLAGLVTATYFGMSVDAKLWKPLADYVVDRSGFALPQFEGLIQQAETLSQGHLRFFHWELEFPEVFFDQGGQPKSQAAGFDVIIGNPPWGADIDREASFFSKRFPDSTKQHKDTYKLFIDLSLQLLKNEGNLGFITPSTFLYQPRYADIKAVLDRYNYTVVNLGEKLFEGVNLPSAILVAHKIQDGSYTRRYLDLTKDARELLPGMLNGSGVDVLIAERTQPFVAVKDSSCKVNDVLVIKDAGVKHQRTGVGLAQKGETDLRARLYSDHAEKNTIPLYTGSNINRYQILGRPSLFLRGNYAQLLNKNEIVYFDKQMMVVSPKIVWRQTADAIRATLLRNAWFANTLQCGIIRDEFKDKVLIEFALAVLNSHYINQLYQQKVLESGRLFPQVKLSYLRELPFPLADMGLQTKVKELVDSVMAEYAQLQTFQSQAKDFLNREYGFVFSGSLDELEWSKFSALLQSQKIKLSIEQKESLMHWQDTKIQQITQLKKHISKLEQVINLCINTAFGFSDQSTGL